MERVVFYTDLSEDGLARKSWAFVLISGVLYLDRYYKESRPSTRHKNWNTEEYYARVGRDQDYRHMGTRVDGSVLTDEIKRIALNEFMAQIKVSLWDR